MKHLNFRLALIAVVALSVVAGMTASAGASPTAQASKNCPVSSHLKKYGPTYTYTLAVYKTTCSTGKKVIKGWDNCRRRNGGYGKGCSSTSGLRCSEHRSNKLGSPQPQYQTKVSCSRGGKRVAFVAKIFKADK
jgi:hypothetical protein